jgi:hypothetical protein
VEFRNGKPYRQVPQAIYLAHYITLPDTQGEVEVWLVDGNLVRNDYKTDYTEGGHGYVYPWIPRPQIWIEDGVDHRELPFITTHEYLERRLMRDAGLEYDRAHEICSTVEFDLRRNGPVKHLMVPSGRKFHKNDLPGITSQEFFGHVLENYVKKKRPARS